MSEPLDYYNPYNRGKRQKEREARRKAAAIKEKRSKKLEEIKGDTHAAAEAMGITHMQVLEEENRVWESAREMTAEELRVAVRRGGGIGVKHLVKLTQIGSEQVQAVASKALLDASVAISKIEFPLMQLQSQQTKTITNEDASILDAYLTTKQESKANE